MNRQHLDQLIVVLVVGGALVSFGVVSWLAWNGTGEGALAAVVGLATILLNHAAGIVRNRFPGPEIDVVPPGFEAGAACTCGKDEDPRP